jgi:hypothetical protein
VLAVEAFGKWQRPARPVEGESQCRMLDGPVRDTQQTIRVCRQKIRVAQVPIDAYSIRRAARFIPAVFR